MTTSSLVANVLEDVIAAGPCPPGVTAAGKKHGTPGEARQNPATIERLTKIVAEIDELSFAPIA